MVVKRGLGKNLQALLAQGSNQVTLDETGSHLLSIEKIKPGKYQPRRHMVPEELESLAASIQKQGLLQPIIVRAIGPETYEIIAGERRWRACQLIDLKEIPVIVKQVDDETAMALALIENIQREDLNAMDQARAMQRLVDEFALTHQQIAELLSKSRAAVSNYLRLQHLAPEVKMMLEQGQLDMGHARALLMLDGPMQVKCANLIVIKNLSVREAEALVTRMKEPKIKDDLIKAELGPYLQEKLQQVSHFLQTKVTVKPSKSGKGILEIHYKDTMALEKVLQLIETELLTCPGA